MSLAVLVVAIGLVAPGHQVGLSRGVYVQSDDHVDLELVLARDEAAASLAGVRDELARLGGISGIALSPSLFAPLVEAAVVESAGARCPGTLTGAEFSDEDGVALRVRFQCPSVMAETTVDALWVQQLSPGHRHIAHVVAADGERDHVVFVGATSFSFGTEAPTPAVSSSFMMGIEHILGGFDHLVFLFGLIVVGGRKRSLVAVLTAFTLAHSVTLALAVLGVWAPPPSIIEPLIALSIAWVGVENFFIADVERRWRITAPFGLIHGFGFAGALGEVGMPRGEVPLHLLFFNLGVETGQLAVLVVVVPLLAAARRHGLLTPRGVKGLSALVVAAGVAWFIERVLPQAASLPL